MRSHKQVIHVLLSISITGMLIVSDEIPIRIIVERNEQEDE